MDTVATNGMFLLRTAFVAQRCNTLQNNRNVLSERQFCASKRETNPIMKRIVTAITLLFATASALHAQSVVGGTISPDDKPFYCRVVWQSYDHFTYYGNGTLIAPEWILTSGISVSDMNSGGIQVDTVAAYMGSQNVSATTPAARYESNFIARHPGFARVGNALEHDIALFHLKRPVTGVTPIGLPAYGDNAISAVGNTGYIIGHGFADTIPPLRPSNELRIAALTIIDNDTCNQQPRYNGSLTTDMLCAGKITGAATGPAYFDLGAPLYVESGGAKVQIGVTSAWLGASVGGFYANSLRPGIFTKVANYRKWIDSTINAYNVSLDVHNVVTRPVFAIRSFTRQGALHLVFSEPSAMEAAYELHDMSGRCITRGKSDAHASNVQIGTGDIVPGIYLFNIRFSNGSRYTVKCSVVS